MMRLLVVVIAAFSQHAASEVVASVDARGHLRLQVPPLMPVFVQGVDFISAMREASAELKSLTGSLNLVPDTVAATSEIETVTADCFCHDGRCSPAVRRASGTVTCCAAAAGSSECRWSEPCNPQAPYERQVMQEVRVGKLVRLAWSSEGLALTRGSAVICSPMGSGSEASSSSSVVPAAAAGAAGAVLIAAIIGIVCWMRRGRRISDKSGHASPTARKFLIDNPATNYLEPVSLSDYEDPNNMEMAPISNPMYEEAPDGYLHVGSEYEQPTPAYAFATGQDAGLYEDSTIYHNKSAMPNTAEPTYDLGTAADKEGGAEQATYDIGNMPTAPDAVYDIGNMPTAEKDGGVYGFGNQMEPATYDIGNMPSPADAVYE